MATWPSLLVAFASGAGTQILSTTSRTLWSQTWHLLLLSLAVLLLVRGRWYWLATVLSWAFFCRPTAAIPVIAVSAYVFLRRRPAFGMYALLGLAWLGAFIAGSYLVYGNPLPPYYGQLLPSSDPGEPEPGFYATHILRDVVSPSRGLLVCVPVTWVACYLGVFRRRERRPLALLAWGCVVLHLFLLGWHPEGPGFCFGARWTADLVPWFALLATLGLAARERFTMPEKCLGAVLLGLSIAINSVGACSTASVEWGHSPSLSVKCWDWHDPQWLAPVLHK